MLHKGDVFGVSALDFDRGCLSKCTYEAASNQVLLYKIPQRLFVKHFEKECGNPVGVLRARKIMYDIWLRQQTDLIRYMSLDEIARLKFQNDKKYAKLKPIKKIIPEIPYNSLIIREQNMARKKKAKELLEESQMNYSIHSKAQRSNNLSQKLRNRSLSITCQNVDAV